MGIEMVIFCSFAKLFVNFTQVDLLKDLLDARLGRNITLKLTRGPLEKRSRKKSKSHSFKRRKLKQHFNKPVVGHAAVDYGDEKTAEKRVLDQEQELRDIEGLSLVHEPSNRAMLSHHVASHVARLSNHRLTILPSSSGKGGGRGTDRKKSSVLVTSVEEDEGYVRELHRQQSRAFIETMIQCPSRQHRVLEKLSCEQMRKISSVERSKAGWRRRSREKESEEEVGSGKVSQS